MDHPAHGAPVLHAAQAGFEIESRKEVVLEKRFCGPGRPETGGATKTNARQEDFDRCVLPEMAGRNVLVFGMGADAEPGRTGRGSLAERRR